MVNDRVERVRASLLPLCEPLTDAFTTAEQRRREALPELAGHTYGWHATHTVRALAHRHLTARPGDRTPWVLAGKHSQNGALWLANSDYLLRVLHCPSTTVVPPPGSNRARQAFYCNPLLPAEAPLFGDPVSDRLLCLWRIDAETQAPAFRVVRPVGTWKWGEHQRTDLDFPLPSTADELAGLAFEPTDDDLGLELPRDDEEGDADAGGITG